MNLPLLFFIRWSKVTVPTGLLNDLLPGPVTVVFERETILNSALNPATNLVGVRVPDHAFIQELALAANAPLALTSANFSSAQSTLSIQVSSMLQCINFH